MPTVATDELAALYLDDETAWLDEMSRRVAEGRREALDFDNLAEYLQSMSIRDRRETFNRLVVLLIHLLKCDYQPGRRSRSWKSTIEVQQGRLGRLLASKTLRNYAGEILAEAYREAARIASTQTGLDRKVFPAECPWSLEQILGEP